MQVLNGTVTGFAHGSQRNLGGLNNSVMVDMKEPPPNKYFSFLLRLWQEEQSTAWRAMLEDTHTRRQVGFSSLAHLFTFLEERTGEMIEHSGVEEEVE